MTIPAQQYVFRATVRRVVDADTVDASIDVGFHTYHVERLRLLRVNAPEVTGATKAAGLASKAFVQEWFAVAGSGLVVQTYLADSFGRYLAEVWRTTDGANLSDDLLAAGMAVPF